MELAFTCKQLLDEVRPLIGYPISSDLHIVPSWHTSEQPGSLSCERERWGIDHVIFLVAEPDLQFSFETARPPKRPVRLHRFPRLTDFTVCVPLHVPVEKLLPEHPDDKSSKVEPASRDLDGSDRREASSWPDFRMYSREIVQGAFDTYCASSDTQRATIWRERYSAEALMELMGRIGRGGWLSRVVDPVAFTEALTLDADVDSNPYDPNSDGDHEGKDIFTIHMMNGTV